VDPVFFRPSICWHTRVSRVTSGTGDLVLDPDGSASVGGLPVLLLHPAGPELKKPRHRYLLDRPLLGSPPWDHCQRPDSLSKINRFLFTR
jgi:hypothetical protein